MSDKLHFPAFKQHRPQTNPHTLLAPHKRYLAVRARVPLALEPTIGGTAERSPLDKVQPSSLKGSVLFSTPIGAKSMRLGGRGRGADEGTVYNAGNKVGGSVLGVWGVGCRLGVLGWLTDYPSYAPGATLPAISV